MQASKIKVKSIYAIRAEDGGLERFRVSAVVQRRIDNSGSPHDYQSHVEGFVVEHRNPELGPHEQLIKLHPDKILGPFEEFAELTQRLDAENAAQKAKRDAITATDLELRALLYQIVNEPVPNDSSDYQQLFRYIGRIDIRPEAVAPLLNALKSLVKKQGG